jgi:hypothetical protein
MKSKQKRWLALPAGVLVLALGEYCIPSPAAWRRPISLTRGRRAGFSSLSRFSLATRSSEKSQ